MSNAELSLQTLLIAAACLITSSCSLHQVQSSPPIPTTVPEKFDHALQGTPGSARWWEDFSVPALTAAVERALEGNLDLRVAWARLAQAAAVAEQAGAARLPQLDASLGAGYQRFWSPEPNVDLSGGEVNIGSKAVSHDAGQFQVSLAAGFEVDLWGRAASQENAAELDRAASRQDLSAIAVTIAAQVVETWTHLAEQLALQVLLERQLKASQTLLHLVKLRFMQGLVASLDVRQQRQQLTAIEAELPLVQGRIAVLRSRLAVLSGHAPQSGSFTIEPALMEPPPLPVVGLPISLLARRPDVQAAKLRVVAADHRVGVAIADQLPAFRLSASTGFADAALDVLFMRWIYNLASSLVAPLFDGGRRAAEVDRTRAVVEERLYSYGHTVIRALKEVDDALTQEARQIDHLTLLSRRLDEARLTFDEAAQRYRQGLTDYLTVLNAVQTVQDTERRLLSAQRQRLAYRIQLHRALGGTWTQRLRQPELAATVGGESNE